MNSNYTEKREFLRSRFDRPVDFRILVSPNDPIPASNLVKGISRNLSASGILFASDHLPAISSVLALDLDYRTTNICREIEEHALIIDNKLIGKVVRIEEKDDSGYDIGVAFIKKGDRIQAQIKNLLK
ncbi:MAG: PilZ domain-containing protein [Candidatus Omnitrophica bacterium]|nr:PilZ domain-containing protein [Candidatus Omnitrophota bacterium]